MLVSSIGYFNSSKHLSLNKNKVSLAHKTTSEGLGLSQQQNDKDLTMLKKLRIAFLNLFSKENRKKEDSLSLIA